MRERGVEVELTDGARELLANLGWDPTYGARPLKRVIQKQLVDKLALAMLEGKFGEGDTVVVDNAGGELTFEKSERGKPRAEPPRSASSARAVIREFKDFALRGNLLELAVAFVMGVAFSAVVASLVDDVFMQFIGAVVGEPDFNDLTFSIGDGGDPLRQLPHRARPTFLLIAFVLFWVVKAANQVMPQKATKHDCPHCLTAIPIAATACAACGRDVPRPARRRRAASRPSRTGSAPGGPATRGGLRPRCARGRTTGRRSTLLPPLPSSRTSSSADATNRRSRRPSRRSPASRLSSPSRRSHSTRSVMAPGVSVHAIGSSFIQTILRPAPVPL